MRSFQTFCLFVIVTMVHFAIVAGVTRLGDGPSEFLSAVDGEAILEDWLSPRKTPSEMPDIAPAVATEEIEIAEVTDEKPVVAAPLATSETNSETKEQTATAEEYSAIVDARFLAGRIESPNPSDYFRDATARPREQPETPVHAEPVSESAEEPRAKKRSAPPVKSETKKPTATPTSRGPHKVRGIRPISG